MSQSNNISDDTVKIIEDAFTELKTNPSYQINSDSRAKGKSGIYNEYMKIILDSHPDKQRDAAMEVAKNRKANDAAGLSDDQYAVGLILNVTPSVIVELFMPSQGSFDWSKVDWISRQAEYDALYKHVERIISKWFNYRIFHPRPILSRRSTDIK